MWKHYLTNLSFILFLRYSSCCLCNINNTSNDGTIEKRQLDLEEFTTTELVYENFTETTPVDKTTYRYTNARIKETTTEQYDPVTMDNYENTTVMYDNIDTRKDINYNISVSSESMEATQTDIDVSGSVSTINESTTEYVPRRKSKSGKKHKAKKCRNFKKGSSFNLTKMADVWQLVYYQLPSKLKCFKLHIKPLNKKEQQRHAKAYGNFNGSVHWEKCMLEIKSSIKAPGVLRKHFLQGTEKEKGVMENIIIDEESCQNSTHIFLHRESADQWLVIKNLLMMRDCDVGDIVVFSKVPMQPAKRDILDALTVFGVHKPNGTMACLGKEDKPWLQYESDISPVDL